jgi:hydrogen peroxide-dependent heme synthase
LAIRTSGVTVRATEGLPDAADETTRRDYRSINAAVRYEMFSVFQVKPSALGENRSAAIVEARAFLDTLADAGVSLRGLYHLAGLRADADWMVWTHAESIEALQCAYNDLRRTSALGRASTPVWSSAAVHRPAEFNKTHVPAFLAGEQPGAYLCVYPFVRSYDWYLLPEADRRTMLADHGKQARNYPDVRANTMAAFALGDYEWILAFEAAEMHRIVDLMRELRATEARRHVRAEVPFFAGPRVAVDQLIAGLP